MADVDLVAAATGQLTRTAAAAVPPAIAVQQHLDIHQHSTVDISRHSLPAQQPHMLTHSQHSRRWSCTDLRVRQATTRKQPGSNSLDDGLAERVRNQNLICS